jgi:hypothetical protein
MAIGIRIAALTMAAFAKAGAAVDSVLGKPLGAVVGVSLGIADYLFLADQAKAALPWSKTNESSNLKSIN